MPSRDEVLEKVKKIVSEHFDRDIGSLTEETKLREDLSADSLDGVEVVMALEDKFEIAIPDNVAQTMVNLGAIVDHIFSNLPKS